MDPEVVGRALSGLGKGIAPGLISRAREMGIEMPELSDDGADLPPAALVQLVRDISFHFFPGLDATRAHA